MNDAVDRVGWFRTAPGRRYGIELGAIVLAKLALLALLYALIVAAQPRADTSPASMRAHVLDVRPPPPVDRRP